ncbi:MAG: hypothetical protein NC305_13340 [Lachnospiraceae bacterium]|nr:hypothetical protein [Butyrivibrio sp.]MCM1344018.1 hypothetical protein [Muribaculaceae bacterium]MCM1411515.1 hypothetical protein [Lachnospiraceae bacterium]
MDLEKILKEQGYTEEQIRAVLGAMAANRLHVSSVEKPEETIRQLQEEKKKLEKDKEELQKAAGASSSGHSEETAAEISRLRETVHKAQVDLQLVKALTRANAADVDYMIYQAEKSGGMKGIKVNEDGSVSGVEELVEGLKKDFATHFSQPKEQELVRTGIKKLENTANVDDAPRTLEEAIAQKLSDADPQ